MKIKNVSGAEGYFAAGKRGVRLANNASVDVADSPEAMADVLASVKTGDLEIVEGPNTSAVIGVTDRPVGVSILLGSVAEGDFVTVSGQAFEFVDTAGAGVEPNATEVLIGASDATAAAALKVAINADATLDAAQVRCSNVHATSAVEIYRTDGDLTTAFSYSVADSGGHATATVITGVDNEGLSLVIVTQIGAASAFTVFTGLKSISSFWFDHHVTATGATAAYDGTATPSGGSIVFANGGSANIVATDTVVVYALGKKV
jgi:hypothetical protein